MNTERSLSAQMRYMVDEWLYSNEHKTQPLADRLARLAEQHFAGNVPLRTNPGAKHYERLMLTCAALEGIMVNVTEDGKTRLAAEFAEEAADYALERIAWREAESVEEAESTDAPRTSVLATSLLDAIGELDRLRAENERLTAKLSDEPHVCRAEGCDDPPRYCDAHAGVDTTVSDATDAATLTDEVYRLQSVLQQAREMVGEMSWKLHDEGSGVFADAVRSLRATSNDLSRHFGVQGKGADHE